MSDWKLNAEWYGHAGHYCLGTRCRFHLATIVGPPEARVLVSTVGEHYEDKEKQPRTIGFEHYFESMVFVVDPTDLCHEDECGGCGLPEVTDWNSMAVRRYMKRAEATHGHMELCADWHEHAAERIAAHKEAKSDV